MTIDDNEATERKRLDAVCEEVRVLLEKHDVGGVLLIGSRTVAAWQFVIPPWSTIEVLDDGLSVRLRSSKTDPSVLERTDQTLSFVGALRAMAGDVQNVFGRMHRAARERLKQHGVEVEQPSFLPGEKRPDPEGGRGN